jgi:AraC-like DNA-binding protein
LQNLRGTRNLKSAGAPPATSAVFGLAQIEGAWMEAAGSFATWEVDDPHNTTRSLAERFRPPPGEARQFWARAYAAADWRRYKAEPDRHRTRVSAGLIGGVSGVGGLICLASLKDRAATRFTIEPPGLDFYCLSFLREGSGEMRPPGSRNVAPLGKDRAAIFRAHPGTVLETSDRSAKLNVWLPASLVRRKAAILFDRSEAGDLEFDPSVECRTGAAASLQRLTEYLFSELGQPGSLFANPTSASLAEDLLVQSILTGLPHNRSALISRQSSTAAPRNVRRAEEFIRSSADEAVTLGDIARAAGCSVRALQLGFRRFRNMTPTAALRQARLERARDEMMRSDGSTSIIGVAARHGFGNPGRFADVYRRAFGENPSETLRGRAFRR